MDDNEKVALLLHLNEHSFENDDREESDFKRVIKSCMANPNIKTILTYERDELMGGCEFKYIYSNTGSKLKMCLIFQNNFW